jgi:hypothetical protein
MKARHWPLVCLVLLVVTGPSLAQPRLQQPADVLELSAGAIGRGQPGKAIEELERLADDGFVHPDVSFSRGVAYLRRAESADRRPGDLGQAAAAFREALLLSPKDGMAERGLEEARIAIAKRQTKADGDVIETVGIGRRFLLSLDPWVLLFIAALGSCATTVGLILRGLGRGAVRSGGTISAGLGAATVIASLPLAYLATRVADEMRVAVVISERAPLLDPQGRAQKGRSPLPEGTDVHVEEERGNLLKIGSAPDETWIRRNQVRLLSRGRPFGKH